MLPNAPDYLNVFHAVDWGTGHADLPRMEIKLEDTYPTAVTRAIKMYLEEPERFQKVMSDLVKQGKLSEKSLPNQSWMRSARLYATTSP